MININIALLDGYLPTADTGYKSAKRLKKIVDRYPNILGLINTSMSFNLDIDYVTFYSIPQRVELESTKFIKANFSVECITEHNFNFIINRLEQNRFFLIKLVEWFKLQNFEYSWSGITQIDDEEENSHDFLHADPDFNNFLNTEITLQKKWYGAGENLNGYTLSNYGENVKVYENYLSKFLTKSAVSIVSESYPVNDRCAYFTEKTLMALAARTLPLWVGGYGSPNEFRRMGFDIFDDYINHSYQYKPTLIERCYYAISDNIRILEDFDYAKQVREKCWDRLEKNYKFSEQRLRMFNQNKIASFPVPVQNIFNRQRKRWRLPVAALPGTIQ